jgi:AcrR family transcriptional regulator
MTKPDKRQEILKAALTLFAEQGFHGTPTSMIAKKAGVAAGTMYCYFESKDVLIDELFRELVANITRVLIESHSPNESIKARFQRSCQEMVRYLIANPLEFRYLEQFLNSPYGVTFRRGRIFGEYDKNDVFRTLFEEGLGQRAMKDIPIVVLYALTFGPLLSVARDHILGFVQLDDQLIEMTIHTIWNSVKR